MRGNIMSEKPLPEETNNSRLLIGGKAMRRIYRTISKSVKFADTILLVGETGVGKDLIAEEIHRLSDRKDKPFKRVSLSALPDTLLESELFGHEKGAFTGADRDKTGIIEAADGGTLYFPEMSDIPQSIQVKLLDFIQYRTFKKVGEDHKKRIKKVDVCLIFATNENPESSVRKKKLRRDFYYRINKLHIGIPPLRERRDEIASLAEYFAIGYSKRMFNKEIGISSEAIEKLQQYHWPGNVRELGNVIENALLNFTTQLKDGCSDAQLTEDYFYTYLEREGIFFGSALQDNDPNPSSWLHDSDNSILVYKNAKHIFKRSYIIQLLQRTGGDIRKVSVTAGLTERRLRKIHKEIGINNGPK